MKRKKYTFKPITHNFISTPSRDRNLKFQDLIETIPAVVCIIAIPELDSIIDGVTSGYFVLILLWITGKNRMWKQIKFPMIIIFIVSIFGLFFPRTIE
ncbi:xanthine/uracil permease-related [Anaeramoeba ignava]|uniref:Xanthine/uracil permease-related n=1 Tax=Anaeramoeba ignava TaxID=1746090 RepID=A0A9Q0RAJ8_ANAIG|nr:xanthine/uracil permease-related [Anaeramoeba ignava]